MPSSWSSRFLSNGSSSTSTPNRNPNPQARVNGRDKPLPRPPSAAFDSPTLAGRDGERAMPSPPRPQTSSVRRHPSTHNRSVSHPLPKIFGRKKSMGTLGQYHDTEVPLDEDLVPVLDESQSQQTPTRAISGKKGKMEDDGEKLNRKCMCCDSKVKVPREMDKFRCMCCLTINDLHVVTGQQDGEREKQGSKHAETFPGGLPPASRPLPLSVERTRAIIDRCVLTYLEARCRREEHQHTMKKPETPLQTPAEKENPLNGVPIRPRTKDSSPKDLTDAPLAASPPDTPQLDETLSAVIRDFTDLDAFAYLRSTTPPIEQQSAPHGPGPPAASVQRKPVPAKPTRRPPPPPIDLANRTPSQKLHPNGNAAPQGDPSSRPLPSPRLTTAEVEQRRWYDRVKTIFRPLEDYIIASFGDFKCLNSSFSTIRSAPLGRTRSDGNIVTPPPEPVCDHQPSPVDLSQLDAKTLLLGDIGENSTWWTGKLDRNQSDKEFKRKRIGEGSRRAISSKSPNVNWTDVSRWYGLIHTAGANWHDKVERVKSDVPGSSKERLQGFANADDIDDDLLEARQHVIRTLFKVTENVLKRPERLLKEPEDLRFLLIILANPSLYPSKSRRGRAVSGATYNPNRSCSGKQNLQQPQSSPRKSPGRESSQHTGILKRIFGLLAHSSDACHRYSIGWFARFDEEHFTKLVDLVASFVTHRISRRSSRPHSKNIMADGGLIPDLSGSSMNTSAQLHAAMGLSGSVKKRPDDPDQEPDYATDWQIKAAAKTMSLLFAANNIWQGRRRSEVDRVVESTATNNASPQAKAKRSGQLLHTSSFYNTLLDYQDMIADFKVWESKRDRFAFCQYPFFLSMGAKIKILEYDARRQMEIKAREAYFDSVIRQKALDGHFHLRVRRDCMVDDSLRQISEAVGAGQEELKKGLRVHFTGEEGVDAGGLRKEWFLMLVRDIFDPNHGLFVYDEDSNTCYFNPNSFETSDQYFLVGALLGLAIYNSTILDIALPPFAFRKLLAAAPAPAAGAANVSSLTGTKGQMTYTLADLAEFRPSLAAGLQQLLDFDGDVQETYCRDFVAPVERYGTVVDVPLISNGENTPVTNANRHEFVEDYVRYLLDTAVVRQFEPFKRGFFQVCAGNALSLFRAEEIELLVRGSDEALDVDSLRAVAVYENWKHFQPPHQMVPDPADSVPVIQWFWDLFAQASPERQRKLLTFITGTDRIPAVGATSLILRVVAGGDGWGGGGKEERERFPVARTCFNMLVLWRYDYREALEEKLWRAVEESEGFGLK
ncbi:putative E3 ubiquitin-protein ligase [Vermiconidia calcicola]|uniref:E3 ubiquitin-protein ligase n=1 Tax=Vermiconidia calcicola TaxID=1690605 RepID=A0ACC3MCC6_9PEZI|nr:putative E3 ubiquitin-protein ligase [Vermiconidia calcicola]